MIPSVMWGVPIPLWRRGCNFKHVQIVKSAQEIFWDHKRSPDTGIIGSDYMALERHA